MKHLYILLFVLPLIGFGQGWEQIFGGPYDDQGISVQQTSDGGYIITGYTMDLVYFDEDLLLIKTDENGNEEWSQIYGPDFFDEEISQVGYSVQQTTDGGYIVTGLRKDVLVPPDVWLIKTDENGEEEWSQTFGGEGFDVGHSVQQTNDGGYVVTGFTEYFELDISGSIVNSNSDVYLIKTDSEGTLSSSFNISTPSPRKLEKVVDALGREVHHTTNQILFHIYYDGSVEKKFIVE